MLSRFTLTSGPLRSRERKSKERGIKDGDPMTEILEAEMKLKFVFTFCALIALSLQSVRGEGIGDVLAPSGQSATAGVTGTPREQRDRANPPPADAEVKIPEAPKEKTVDEYASTEDGFEEYMRDSGYGRGSSGSPSTSQDSNQGNGGSIPGSQWRITNAYDWDDVNSPEHAALKNHGANNDDVSNIMKNNQNLCSHLNADFGPDYYKCRRKVILYNEKAEDAKDAGSFIPMLAKAKTDSVGAMGQAGSSPRDTMELSSKFDMAMGVMMLTRGSRADGAQEENTTSARENRIMAAQNEGQILKADKFLKDKGTGWTTIEADEHAGKFRALADEGDVEAAKWDGKQSEARWGGLAMLGMGYFQHDLARKFDDDAEKRITDPVGLVQPGTGLQPFAQNNPQPIPQAEYFGEQKQDPEANGYDQTGAEVGSGNAASTGQLGLSQMSPSQSERDNGGTPARPMSDEMGLNRYSGSDGSTSGNDDIKKYLDSVFGKNQGEGSAASHKPTEFGNADENLAKVKALGKNEDIFKYISRIHKEQLGS